MLLKARQKSCHAGDIPRVFLYVCTNTDQLIKVWLQYKYSVCCVHTATCACVECGKCIQALLVCVQYVSKNKLPVTFFCYLELWRLLPLHYSDTYAQSLKNFFFFWKKLVPFMVMLFKKLMSVGIVHVVCIVFLLL